jgi:hypothetical protein
VSRCAIARRAATCAHSPDRPGPYNRITRPLSQSQAALSRGRYIFMHYTEVSGLIHAPGERAPVICCIRGWVGPKSGLDAVETIISCLYRESNTNFSLLFIPSPYRLTRAFFLQLLAANWWKGAVEEEDSSTTLYGDTHVCVGVPCEYLTLRRHQVRNTASSRARRD